MNAHVGTNQGRGPGGAKRIMSNGETPKSKKTGKGAPVPPRGPPCPARLAL